MIKQPQIVKGALLESLAVCRLSALGDVVMMVPMVRTIQRAFPKLAITWIISRAMHTLLEGMDGVEFIVIDKPRSIADYWRLRKQLKAYRFDVLLAAQANLRVNLIYPLIKAKCRVGFDSERSREGHRWFVDQQIQFYPNHILESFLQFSNALGAIDVDMRWDLPIAACDWQFAKQQLGEQRYVAINPCASKADRDWPINRTLELIAQIKQRWQCSVVLTGGNSDKERLAAEQVMQQTSGSCLNLVGKTSLKQLAAVLGTVEVLVSPDTGPAHLACAMATPVVGLYADITSKLSGPYLHQDLVVDRYEQALLQYRKKKMDEVPWITRVHNKRAMELITVDDVMQSLEKVLNKE